MNVYTPVFVMTPVLMALALGIIGFVFQYQRKMLQHQEHLRKIQEVKQRQLLDATVQAQEEERRRVARDLHDDVGAMLALVKLNLHQLSAAHPNKEAGNGVKGLLDEIIVSIRRISQDLMPVVLEKMGLAEAIGALKKLVPAASGLQFEFQCNDRSKRFDVKTELFLYRVVQELFNNTLKHANASKVSIDMSIEGDSLVLKYSDNGKGFDYDGQFKAQQADKAGLGLINLNTRIALLRGSFNLESEPDNGTKAIITVPVA